MWIEESYVSTVVGMKHRDKADGKVMRHLSKMVNLRQVRLHTLRQLILGVVTQSLCPATWLVMLALRASNTASAWVGGPW